MKKIVLVVVLSIILSVVLTLVGVLNTLPLLTLMRYGLLSLPVPEVAIAFIQNEPSAGPIEWAAIVLQLILGAGCSFGLFSLLLAVMNTFEDLDNHFKKMYYAFFFLLIVTPLLLVLLSAFLHFPLQLVLWTLGVIVGGSSVAITVIVQKVLPETDINPDREYLYS